MGAEAYGSLETSRQKAAMAVAQTKQFARTAWVVTTETNNNENVMGKYESGQWGYESAEIMEKHFDAHFNAGIKGIYDFLLADRVDLGGKLGMAYSHVTQSGKSCRTQSIYKENRNCRVQSKDYSKHLSGGNILLLSVTEKLVVQCKRTQCCSA